MMGDDWGDQRGVLMGPARWRRFYKPRYARIIEAIHGRASGRSCTAAAAPPTSWATSARSAWTCSRACQPEAAGMNPYALKKAWGDRITFWGCLGSQSTIPFAAPDELRARIRDLRTGMSRRGGFILAPAKPLRPETPLANAVALVEEFLA